MADSSSKNLVVFSTEFSDVALEVDCKCSNIAVMIDGAYYGDLYITPAEGQLGWSMELGQNDPVECDWVTRNPVSRQGEWIARNDLGFYAVIDGKPAFTFPRGPDGKGEPFTHETAREAYSVLQMAAGVTGRDHPSMQYTRVEDDRTYTGEPNAVVYLADLLELGEGDPLATTSHTEPSSK